MYENAAQLTLRYHGGTFTPAGRPVDTRFLRGYMVGGVVPTAIVPRTTAEELRQALTAFVAAYEGTFRADASLFLGTWIDDDSVYIDVVEYISDREAAVALAQSRGELAIWDCYAGNEVNTEVE